MLIPFTKMQAQGNDFVILNLLGQTEVKYQLDELAEDVCEPAFGIGADGLVALLDDSEADARMLIYNSDGSRPRCVAPPCVAARSFWVPFWIKRSLP